MIKASVLLTLASLACLGGCTSLTRPKSGPPPMPEPRPSATTSGWRAIATQPDRNRFARWRGAWTSALAQARRTNAADIAREGALLDPDAALAWGAPPSGEYRCRVIKLGSQSGGSLVYVPYQGFTCRIRSEGASASFAKLTGSQRPVGFLLPDAGPRMIFLGTMQLGDETRALQYGHDPDRDMIGLVERIGARRWRLVVPYPRYESTLDVFELVPQN